MFFWDKISSGEKSRKYYIYTLGCKVNSYESEVIAEHFNNADFSLAGEPKDANVIVVNTCTVTNQADSKSRKTIRQARRENPEACLIVCGCSAENHKESLIDLDIDILIGNKDKSLLVKYALDFLKNKNKIEKFYDLRNVPFEEMSIKNFEGKTRGFVKIQDGCNNFCSYCIIPFMRGNIRSKNIDVATEEINCLANNGYKEIVLTGIHTGSYGAGCDYRLVDLIRNISKNENLERIRISSIEITELDEDFMEELKTNKKIVDHMHIPIQAGSDHVLEMMRRKYKLVDYIKKIDEIRTIRPEISITTDLIVGFPEETDEDFENTLKVVEQIGFAKVHTFPYSMRTGTLASTFKQVNDTVKKNRTKQMLELSDVLENKYYKSFIGKELEVLVENDNSGFTSNYIKVNLDQDIKPNTLVKVVITEVDGLTVKGKVK